jgi:hypothetical protein
MLNGAAGDESRQYKSSLSLVWSIAQCTLERIYSKKRRSINKVSFMKQRGEIMLQWLQALLVMSLLSGCTSLSGAKPSATDWLFSQESQRKDTLSNSWEMSMKSHAGYRMTVEMRIPNSTGGSYCEQQIEVRDSKATLLSDTCGDGIVRDVNYWFEFIAERQTYYAEHPTCGPNGCQCDGPINVDVTYHIWRGYPMIVRERPFPEYRDRTIGQQLLGISPICTAMGFERVTMVITSFVPLP